MARRYSNPYAMTLGDKIAACLATGLILLALSGIALVCNFMLQL